MTRDKRGGKTGPIRTSSPVLREVFEMADLRGASITWLSVKTNLTTQSISNWRKGSNAPNILAVEEMANAMGYKLILQKIDN